MSTTTKDPIALAQAALKAGEASLEAYSHPKSPQKFTQAQIFAILVLRQFFKTDYRGITATLARRAELREAIGITRVPHYSTLCYAEERLLKKKSLSDFLKVFSDCAAKAA